MNIAEYQRYVKEGASKAYTKELALIGATGELGELADVIKKEHIYHDNTKFIMKYGMSIQDKIKDELGDVLWQIVNVANQYDMDIEDVLNNNVKKLNNRHGGPKQIANDGGIR